MTICHVGKDMVKLLSSHIALDSIYLYNLPQGAIYHYVSRIARVHDPLSKESNPRCGGKFYQSVHCHFESRIEYSNYG